MANDVKQVPSIGRIVHYRYVGLCPDYPQETQAIDDYFPAIITNVIDEKNIKGVCLIVFTPFGLLTPPPCQEGEEPCTYRWPPFVPPWKMDYGPPVPPAQELDIDYDDSGSPKEKTEDEIVADLVDGITEDSNPPSKKKAKGKSK